MKTLTEKALPRASAELAERAVALDLAAFAAAIKDRKSALAKQRGRSHDD